MNGEEKQPPWRPIDRIQRRVLGVLVEKAKTTPDQYPMSLNGITTGCNQKSNRSPQMQLDPDDVLATLDELREMSAVIEVQSGGRVPKYKHLMYEWLGVDKTELAIMTELLLRGEQTIGELRGRAARMEPIPDLGALRPIIRGLIDRQLVVELTSEGRGQVVTHNLYQPEELARLRTEYADGGPEPDRPERPKPAPSTSTGELAQMQRELAALRSDLETLRTRLDRLES